MAGGFSVGFVSFYLMLGLAAGVMSAMFGVGSGILVVPALTLAVGLTQKESQGVALTVMVPMALVGALRYYFNPDIQVDYKIVAVMAVTVILGANLGATIVGQVTNRHLQFGFAFLLFAAGLRMFMTAWKAGT